MGNMVPDSNEMFDRVATEPVETARYVLRLYVTGMTPRSTHAVAALKAICKEHLEGQYDLEVIDVYQHPELAKEEQLVALPMLVKQLPLPMRRLIGNLSDQERVLFGLDLQRRDE
jgi:circadian clock protein KaiB